VHIVQCCQMVYFQTKNPNLGKFWKVLQWKMMVFFMAILSILRPNDIFYGHLVHFVVIWYIFHLWYICSTEKIWHPSLNKGGRTVFFQRRRSKNIHSRVFC
jgi:hypothetical protein